MHKMMVMFDWRLEWRLAWEDEIRRAKLRGQPWASHHRRR